MAAVNNSNNSVYCALPLGRPNPSEKFVSFPNDPRSRVIKPAQDGPTCFINALYWMIPRIGKHPDCQHLKERGIEKIVSSFRKERDQNEKSSSEIKCRVAIAFFDKLGLDDIKKRINYINWADETSYGWMRKATALNRAANKQIASLYGLKFSSWRPSEPISKLIEELKAKGPLLANGYFGNDFYKGDGPDLKESVAINGVVPWGWSPAQALPLIEARTGHAVVICGAQIMEDGREFVYFKDPNFTSVPLHLRQPRFYFELFVISYQKFKTHILLSQVSDALDYAIGVKPSEYLLYSPYMMPEGKK